jgi:hypothetical protein
MDAQLLRCASQLMLSYGCTYSSLRSSATMGDAGAVPRMPYLRVAVAAREWVRARGEGWVWVSAG